MSSRKVQVKKGNSRRSRSLHLSGAHTSQKRVPLSVRKRKIRIIISVLIILALVLLTGFLAWGSRHPVIAVEEVEVSGTKALSHTEVEEAAEAILNSDEKNIFSRKNIFLYPKKRIQEEVLRAFPRAMTASVALSSFKEPILILNIEERTAVALWCNEENCFLVDESGFIFAEADGISLLKGFYEFKGGVVENSPIGVTLLPNHFSQVLRLLNEIENLGVDIVSVDVQNDEDYNIIDADEMVLRVKFSQPNYEVISNLKAIMGSSALRDQEVEYIDLRFGKRVYYKFKREAK